MYRLLKRLSLPILMSVALAGALPVSSVAAWTSSCSTDGINGNRVCIYANQNYGLPRAGTNGTVDLYSGNFPNSSIPLNDSTSSMSNLYLSKDMRWYWDANQGGFNWCVDSWYSVADLGFLDNDQFSSHLVLAGDNAC